MNNETIPVDADIRALTCSQSQLARALGISRQRINTLADKGVVVRDANSCSGEIMFFDSLRNYYSSKFATDDGSDSVNFWHEKGLHEKAKRELAELKLERTRNELYYAADVKAVISEILTNFRDKLSGLPVKFAPKLENKTRAEIYDVLTVAVEKNLSELAAEMESDGEK